MLSFQLVIPTHRFFLSPLIFFGDSRKRARHFAFARIGPWRKLRENAIEKRNMPGDGINRQYSLGTNRSWTCTKRYTLHITRFRNLHRKHIEHINNIAIRRPTSSLMMKLSLSAGTIAVLLSSVADASSQYRNPSGGSKSSAKHRRIRSAIQRDDYNDADYHRSLSSATWEEGSGHSSSPSLNYEWDIDESSSSSFYDIEDVERRRKKRKRKRDSMQETERILQALEKGSREEEELAQSKRSKRKKSRARKTADLPPPMSPKSTKKRRSKVNSSKTSTKNSDLIKPRNISTNQEEPFVKRDFASKTKSSPPVSQPKSHPDRTKWEVPSYSHKISTMMNKKKKNESTSKPRTSSTTSLSRPTTTLQGSRSTVASTAGNVPTIAAHRSKPTPSISPSTTNQSSTLGSSTTLWVRKFLAARPKGKQCRSFFQYEYSTEIVPSAKKLNFLFLFHVFQSRPIATSSKRLYF